MRFFRGHDKPTEPTEIDRLLALVRLGPGITGAGIAAEGRTTGRDLVRTVAAHSLDGVVLDDLEFLDTVADYAPVIRDIAQAAGRASDLTRIECDHVEGDLTCTIRTTLAGATFTDEPDWYGDYADGMFLAAMAERLARAGMNAVVDLDEDLVVLYVPDHEYAWVDDLIQHRG